MNKEKDSTVSATELAKLGVCERKIYLRGKYGDRLPSQTSAADRMRGDYLHQVAKDMNYQVDSRCFIATHLYGIDVWQTNVLRQFRDEVFMTHGWGRCLIWIYYQISPILVRQAERFPVLGQLIKPLIDHIVKWRLCK